MASQFELDLATLIGAAKQAERYHQEWVSDHATLCKYECKCGVAIERRDRTKQEWLDEHDRFLKKWDPARKEGS